MQPQELIALGLSLKVREIVSDKTRVGQFGILVTALPSFDPAYLIGEIGKLRQQNFGLRLAIAGFGEIDELKSVALTAGFPEDTFAADLLAAGRWRNTPNISDIPIAIARGEQPTLHTLAAFTTISSAEVAVTLLHWAENEDNGVAVNVSHSNFFMALTDNAFAELHNPTNVAVYLSELLEYNEVERLEQIRELLPRLGLMRDPDMFSVRAGVSERLRKNLEYCRKVRYLSGADRKRIARRLQRFPDEKRIELESSLLIVENYRRTFAPEDFERLTLQQVQDLITLRPPKKKPQPEGEIIEPGDDEDEVLDAAGLHQTFAEALIDGNEDTLRHIAEALVEAFDEEDPQDDRSTVAISAEEIDLEAELHRDDKLLEFVHSFCSGDCWGGSFETEQGTLQAAIDHYNHVQNCLSPYETVEATDSNTSLVELLERMSETLREKLLESGKTVPDEELPLPAFRQFEAARLALLPLVDRIMIAPLETVGATPERFRQFREYVDAAHQLFKTLKNHYEALSGISDRALRICVARLLALDMVLVKTVIDDQTVAHKAILMPLHPLHLWKFVRLIEIYTSGEGDLESADRMAMIAEAASDRHFLNTLYVSEILTGDQPTALPFAGSVGSLPCYENTSNHYSGNDGLKSLFYTLERFIAFYPLFVRPLRITIVDVPSLADLLAEVARFLNKHAVQRLPSIEMHLFFTQASVSRSYLASLTSGENESIYQEFVAIGRLNLRIQTEACTFEGILEAHEQHPVHLMALFDQSELQVRKFQRQQFFPDSPFCVTREYQYDQVLDLFSAHPVNDADLFTHYNDLVNRLQDNLSKHSLDVIGKIQKFRHQLDQVLQEHRTQWLFIADRVLPAEKQLASPRIYARRDGRREVLVLASTSRQFARELELMLKHYNLYPKPEQIEELLLDFSHMVGDGLLSIIKGKDGTLVESISKGLIGLLVAARAYKHTHPDSLIVAIDSQDARRWLRVTEAQQRADLVGVRVQNGEFVVDVIEVKAREEETNVFVRRDGKIEGQAVRQVAAIKAALEQAFADHDSPLTPPRREVLRDLLYVECQSRRYDQTFRAKWAQRLDDIFNPETSVRFETLIYQVDLKHNRDTEIESLRADLGDDDGMLDILFIAIGERDVQKLLAGIDPDEFPPPDDDLPPMPKDPLPPPPDEPPTTPDYDDPDASAPDDQSPPPVPIDAVQVTQPPSSPQDMDDGTLPTTNGPQAHLQPALAEALTGGIDPAWLQTVSEKFSRACEYYGIKVTRCRVKDAIVGLSIVRFPFQLERGTRKERLDRNLEDIGREMAISNLIIQTIPDSQFLALDVPHPERRTPRFIPHGREALPKIQSIEALPVALGVSPYGGVRIVDLRQIVHMLVGGTTGAGKTVFLYSVILSLLTTHPNANDLELILCSSKLEDFGFFAGLPHLFGREILTDTEDAIEVIGDIAYREIEERQELLSSRWVRSVEEFNQLPDIEQKLRPIVIVVDEFADLSDQANRNRATRDEFYTNIRRIAQIGRSRSIHLVLCTQRPTADLFPSSIKTLMNARVAFRMNSQTDSRTILDEGGAEKLLGKGDMLFKWESVVERLQGFLVETSDIVD